MGRRRLAGGCRLILRACNGTGEVRDHAADRQAVYLVSTKKMTADVFTKAVDEETFEFCKHTLRNTTRESYVTRKVSRLTAAR